MSNKFIVETSARHVHLTAEAVEILFGKGHTLTNKKDLSQPGQFACEEKVTVVGPRVRLRQAFSAPHVLTIRLSFLLQMLVLSEFPLLFVSPETLRAASVASSLVLQAR